MRKNDQHDQKMQEKSTTPTKNKKFYALYRTNGVTNYYQYIGISKKNAKAVYLLYRLFSHENIRKDHTLWKLSAYEVSELLIDGWEDYFTIDSYEMIPFEKKYPIYLDLLSELPENIDVISNKLDIYDKWLSLIRCHQPLLDLSFDEPRQESIDELMSCFKEEEL